MDKQRLVFGLAVRGQLSVRLNELAAVPGEQQKPRAASIAGRYVVATWFGVGFIRVAPGTMATATVLPLYWLARLASMPLQWVIAGLIVVLSILSAQLIAKDLDQNDPQIVVIDEVCGALLALLVVDSAAIMPQLAALFLFRLFDIFKPWPISASVGGHAGFNIVYDDVVAGLCAGLIVRFIM